MKRLPTILFAVLISSIPAAAENPDDGDSFDLWSKDKARVFAAEDIRLDAFKWRPRPVVIFADSEFDPAFDTQLTNLTSDIDEAIERDVVIITDTNPGALSDLRRQLRPQGFTLMLIGKDGSVKLRKPFPWTMRELSRAIDKMPLRQRELGEKRQRASPAK